MKAKKGTHVQIQTTRPIIDLPSLELRRHPGIPQKTSALRSPLMRILKNKTQNIELYRFIHIVNKYNVYFILFTVLYVPVNKLRFLLD